MARALAFGAIRGPSLASSLQCGIRRVPGADCTKRLSPEVQSRVHPAQGEPCRCRCRNPRSACSCQMSTRNRRLRSGDSEVGQRGVGPLVHPAESVECCPEPREAQTD
ncbi:hypothetical protein LIA77_05735 [Sarocladium implicatum]|nr:hypothetical protein LIA77_05735 [Sarocladium implicatum]